MKPPLFTAVVCPICRGHKRSMQRVMSALFTFPTVLDPEYNRLIPGEIWRKEIFVCAACLGSGMASDCLARTLSGEFQESLEKGQR